MESREYATYPEALQLVGVTKPTLLRRIEREGITIFVNPRDNRRRLLRRADLLKLTEPRPVRDTEPAREFDGSGS